MLSAILKRLLDPKTIDPTEGNDIIARILDSDNTLQIAAALMLCQTRNENEQVTFIFNLVQQLRRARVDGHSQAQPDALDIVGTGGDHRGSLNISTATALLLASSHIPVAKHGNRRVSSHCGSADVLEALGMNLERNHATIPYFSFYFAPNHHPLLNKFSTLRQQLAVPTLFNYCGPLLNPAQPARALIGVHDPKMLPIYARLCPQLGFRHVLLVHTEGLDELACVANPHIVEFRDQQVRSYSVDITDLGLDYCQPGDLAGGDVHYNAQALMQIFSGAAHPARDTFILNVAAGCYLYGLTATIKEAIPIARSIVESQSVLTLIKQLQESPLALTPH